MKSLANCRGSPLGCILSLVSSIHTAGMTSLEVRDPSLPRSSMRGLVASCRESIAFISRG